MTLRVTTTTGLRWDRKKASIFQIALLRNKRNWHESKQNIYQDDHPNKTVGYIKKLAKMKGVIIVIRTILVRGVSNWCKRWMCCSFSALFRYIFII
jgi:hypothetical protein